MDRLQILTQLEEYKKVNSEKYGINALGLFGSYARLQATNNSDIDIVIKIATPDPYIIVHIKEDLEATFNRNIDIVRLRESMNPFLKKRIENEAVYV